MRLLYIQQSPEETVIGLETDSVAVICPNCESAKTVGYGRMNLRVRDIPIEARKVLLEIKRRRLRCQKCHKTFNEPVAKVSEHHRATERLVEQVGNMAMEQTFSALSREIGMDEKTIRNIFAELLERLKEMPRPHAPAAMVLWTPVILRVQRAIWINPAENTIIAMDTNCKPATIKATLHKLQEAGGASTLHVPLDASVIKTVREACDAVLRPHARSVKAEFALALGDCRANGDTEAYATALECFFQARTEREANAMWSRLPSPPAALRNKMRNLLAAIELLGPACFVGSYKDDLACDQKINLLEGLMATSFSRRSYDVVHAVMMFDKHLHKSRRIPNSSGNKPTLLGYKKLNFGTSIPKLINRLKGMAINTAEEV